MNDAPRISRAGRRPRKLRRVTIGKREVLTAGLTPSLWNDVYHVAMTARLPVFVAGIAAAFLATNALFALLYWLDPAAIANAGGGFEELFYFSIETITTVGYGELFPQTRYAHILVSAEVFTGLFFSATMLGLIFARMSRPRARLLFARRIVVGPYDGRSTLFLRVANARQNNLSAVTARLWVLILRDTAEGTRYRRFEELKLLRAENPTFALSWTLLHPIDEASPLHGLGPEGLVALDVFFVVNIEGHDQSSAQAVHTSESYQVADLFWDHRYADVLSTEGGMTVLDYARFHDIEPLAPPPA